jgi:hypothetical protein
VHAESFFDGNTVQIAPSRWLLQHAMLSQRVHEDHAEQNHHEYDAEALAQIHAGRERVSRSPLANQPTPVLAEYGRFQAIDQTQHCKFAIDAHVDFANSTHQASAVSYT